MECVVILDLASAQTDPGGASGNEDRTALGSWAGSGSAPRCNLALRTLPAQPLARPRPAATSIFELYERVPASVSRHLRRFGRLHPSDWFLNRALWHILLGAEVRNARRADGKPFTRGVEYRAKAALGFLLKWRDRCASVPSLRSRGLTPRCAESVAEVKTAIKLLAPYVDSNRLALSWMGQARSAKAWRELSSWVRGNPCVTPRLKKTVKENRSRLPLPPD